MQKKKKDKKGYVNIKIDSLNKDTLDLRKEFYIGTPMKAHLFVKIKSI